MTTDRTAAEGTSLPATEEAILAQALTVMTFTKTSDAETLRQAVVSYVAEARTKGLPPEAVLARLKTELKRSVGPRLDPKAYRGVVASAVTLAIDEYYRGR